MKSRVRPALVGATAGILLAACGHARVVRVDGQSTPPTAATRAATRPATPMPRPAPEPVPRGGFHVVQPGETLYGISFRFGLQYQDVAAWNQLNDASRINVGQRLRLRAPVSAPVTAPARSPVVHVPAPTPSSAPTPSPAPVAPAPTAPIAAPSAPAAAPVVTTAPRPAPTPATAAPVWRWPTSGQVVGRFVAGDPTEQGIDIAGNGGQAVNAAADGVVVYSGAGLVGYGELVIIKHSDQWLSAYGHNRRRLVAEGAQVKAGDAIAEMGRTGAARDMLHFEIRFNGKPVDPLQYLPAK